MKWSTATLTLTLLWLTYANAQVKFDQRQESSGSTGIGLTFQENILTVGGTIASNTSEQSQIFLSGGLSFFTNSKYEIPPAPEVAVGSLVVLPFREIDLFCLVAGNAGFLKPRHLTIYILGFTSGIGFLKRIETQSELAITPYLGVYLNNYWLTSKRDTVSERQASGSIGLVAELSPTKSISGSINFSFEDTDSSFSIGMIFH